MEAANDIAAFISIFFEHFTKLKGRALHLAGESYGVSLNSVHQICWTYEILQGRYIPVFASTIYDRNAELEKAGIAPINLASIMIGMYIASYSAHIRTNNQDPPWQETGARISGQ